VTARAWVTTGVVAGLALISAAPAVATTRYAGPTGDLDPDCTNQAAPCELQHAVETVAQNGDEVVVLPGNYNLGADKLEVSKVIDLHGAAGQPRPRLVTSAASYGVEVGADGAAIRHLAIEQIGSGVNGALSVRAMATAERLVVTSFGSSSDTACDVALGALLRDSVCRDTEDHGIGVMVDAVIDTTARLRNVTAVAQGTTGWGVLAFPGSGAEVTISAKNVIASGPEADVRSLAPGAGDIAMVTLDHSNYATELEDGAGTATVTDPGSGTNQTTAPLFADPALGDLHQRPASPTIDAGTTDPLLGARDLDGEPRNQGAAPDIGADELGVPSPPPPDDHLNLQVDARRKQKAAKLKVTVSCPEEPCEAEIGGKAVAKKKRGKKQRAAAAGKKGKNFKLKPKPLSLEAGEPVTQRLKYKRNRNSVKNLKRLLKRKAYRKKTKAKIKVTAGDAAGNSASEKLKVKLRR